MEFMVTLHPELKAGVRMRNETYRAIKDAMVSILAKYESMPSESFFGTLHEQFVSTHGETTGWYLYQVKLDLEARGMIKSEYSKGRRNKAAVITILKPKRSSYSRARR